jgi:hypothetical protein
LWRWRRWRSNIASYSHLILRLLTIHIQGDHGSRRRINSLNFRSHQWRYWGCGIAREVALIKHCIVADDKLPGFLIVENPALVL